MELLGGGRHIWGYFRLGLRPADPCIGEVLSGGAVPFLRLPSVCHGLHCSPPPQAERKMGQTVRGSDCHSECLDPLLRGRAEQFGGGWTVRPLWDQIVTICKRLWVKTLQCQMVRVRVSQCLNGGVA